MIVETRLTYVSPAPWCRLEITHPARAYISADKTDVRKTILEHLQPVVDSGKRDLSCNFR